MSYLIFLITDDISGHLHMSCDESLQTMLPIYKKKLKIRLSTCVISIYYCDALIARTPRDVIESP